jgi:hypothetical protein
VRSLGSDPVVPQRGTSWWVIALSSAARRHCGGTTRKQQWCRREAACGLTRNSSERSLVGGATASTPAANRGLGPRTLVVAIPTIGVLLYRHAQFMRGGRA